MKVQDYDFQGVPQQVKDFKEDVTFLLNFGKYQVPVVTASAPNWTGRAGEMVAYINGGSGRLYVCTTDNTNTWTAFIAFAGV